MKANPNYTYLKERIDSDPIILLQGGTRSGKTYSTIYFFIDFCLRYSGLEIDIVRDTYTALYSTVWKDFEDVLKQCGLYHSNDHNKSKSMYRLNGNMINYYGADNSDKVHGRSRDILWINEAQQFPEETIDQLLPRTRHRTICDYNPAMGLDHWLDPYIEKYPPLITTYKDNPHLTSTQIEEIELRMARSEYYRKVYGNGERAPRQGVIFENWEEGSFDESLPYCFGMDYGMSPDPLALVEVAVDEKRKKIYIREHAYDQNLSIDSIVSMIGKSLRRPKDLIVCDLNEQRTTRELRNKYKFNTQDAHKKQIVDDIRNLLGYIIVVDPNSHNVKKELNNYIWNDKKGGVPIDAFNHTLDPMRYCYNRLKRPAATKTSIAKFKRR